MASAASASRADISEPIRAMRDGMLITFRELLPALEEFSLHQKVPSSVQD